MAKTTDSAAEPAKPPKPRKTTKLDEELHQAAKIYVAKRRISIGDYLDELVRADLMRNDPDLLNAPPKNKGGRPRKK